MQEQKIKPFALIRFCSINLKIAELNINRIHREMPIFCARLLSKESKHFWLSQRRIASVLSGD